MRRISLREWCIENKRQDLLDEWDNDKNGGLSPDSISYGSGKKIWWKCSKGHNWQVSSSSRIYQGTGCPICSNKKVLIGYNDLATTNPEIAKEWNYEKNGELRPTDVTYGCQRKVWWKCQYGHEWFISPNTRTNQRTGCPLCSGKGTSLPEQGISFYLETVCNIERRAKIEGQEVDIYLPEYKIGIEYDGRFYHPSINASKENTKDNKLAKNGIRVIRIKESKQNHTEKNYIYYKADNMHSNYEWAVRTLCVFLVRFTGNTEFSQIDIDVQRDLIKIRERLDLYFKDNSLANTYPELAKEWNYEKNGIISPEMVFAQSNKSVWWKGQCSHEWKSSPNNRVNGKNCPYCSGQKILVGFNDLKTKHPELAKEWNYAKNNGLIDKNKTDISTPDKVTATSGQRVWWICSKGHEWQYRIADRVEGDGCPYCSGRRADKGKTDLATLFPDIAAEWHPNKNGDLKPSEIRPNYGKAVWWMCSKGHEWKTSPNNRINGNTGCPKCFRLKVGKRV